MDMRHNVHLKFKEWNDRKKYSKKSIEGYFFKTQNSPPPACAIQKNLVSNGDFEKEKKKKKQKQNEMKEKKHTKKSEDVKLQPKTKNLSEYRRQKRTKRTRKKCGQYLWN